MCSDDSAQLQHCAASSSASARNSLYSYSFCGCSYTATDYVVGVNTSSQPLFFTVAEVTLLPNTVCDQGETIGEVAAHPHTSLTSKSAMALPPLAETSVCDFAPVSEYSVS